MRQMNVLVEDDVSKFPYQLLKGYGNVLEGSYGDQSIVDKMYGEFAKDTIVQVDVVADNRNTLEVYRDAVLKAKELENVFVIPIPCIEYYFIRAFLGYSVPEAVTVITFGDYTKCVKNHRGRRLSTTIDFEHFCKSVVGNYTDCFKSNKFVRVSCLCDNPKTSFCDDALTLEIKRQRMLNTMPVTTHVMNKVMLGDVSYILNIINNCEYLYNSMAKSFKDAGIIIDIIPLEKQI